MLLASLYLFPHPENGICNSGCEKPDISTGRVEHIVKCSRMGFIGKEQKLIQMSISKKRSVEGGLRVQP